MSKGAVCPDCRQLPLPSFSHPCSELSGFQPFWMQDYDEIIASPTLHQKIMVKQTVTTWKRRITKEAAKEYKVKPDAVRIVPRDSKRPIYATWQLLQPILCPVNNKDYRVYWVRTNEEFMQGVRR